MKTPEDKRLIGEIVGAKHEELRDRPERMVLIDNALIGALLYLAKQSLPKRQYVPFLREYTGISQRQGARYQARMRKYLKTRKAELEVEKEMEDLLWPFRD